MRRGDERLVLALYPSTRGLAFALFLGPSAVVDWGLQEFRGEAKNARTLVAVEKLLDRYAPAVVVLEDTDSKDSRRSMRIRALYSMIGRVIEARRIEVHRHTQAEVRRHFAPLGAHNKEEIARAIAKALPALATRLPPPRKIWMSEDPRQSLFDAAALGLTYYSCKSSRSQQDPS